jgi:GPI mannosyltransferase 2
VLVFVVWKVLLLCVAGLSPGPGYDTSTQLLLDRHRSTQVSTSSRILRYIVLRLTRWDAIYFTSSSERGHVYEQEWAFSWVLAKITSAVARGACRC